MVWEESGINGFGTIPINHKVRKVGTKHTKVKTYFLVLCDLCVIPVAMLYFSIFVTNIFDF